MSLDKPYIFTIKKNIFILLKPRKKSDKIKYILTRNTNKLTDQERQARIQHYNINHDVFLPYPNYSSEIFT